MPDYSTRPLDAVTWPDFAELVEAHNGVWGGCWCMAFHPEGVGRGKSPGQNRAEKEVRLRESRAHAALVYDGATRVGWCQFGVPDELPRIKNRRAYLDGLGDLPDWRITCSFADRGHRGRGVASAALAGALEEVARLGGGTVESYPDEVEDRKMSASFLHIGTVRWDSSMPDWVERAARPAPSSAGRTRDHRRRRAAEPLEMRGLLHVGLGGDATAELGQERPGWLLPGGSAGHPTTPTSAGHERHAADEQRAADGRERTAAAGAGGRKTAARHPRRGDDGERRGRRLDGRCRCRLDGGCRCRLDGGCRCRLLGRRRMGVGGVGPEARRCRHEHGRTRKQTHQSKNRSASVTA